MKRHCEERYANEPPLCADSVSFSNLWRWTVSRWWCVAFQDALQPSFGRISTFAGVANIAQLVEVLPRIVTTCALGLNVISLNWLAAGSATRVARPDGLGCRCLSARKVFAGVRSTG